jgi:hypothetical protein
MPDKDRHMKRFIKPFRWLFFALLFGIALFLTLQVHRETGRFNWQSEVYADGAGYYAYLPVTFLYRFDFNEFPAGIDDSVSCRFIDHQNRKFVYKYTCGVALLVSPFFAATVLVSEIAGFPLEGGFSDAFHRMADVAAVFYLILGLFLTGEVLKRYVSPPVRYVVILVLFAGTNLYFYAVRQPLMSHVYSFAVISLFILALHRYLEKKSWKAFMLLAFAASLAILVRPVNGAILILLPFWDTGSLQALKERIGMLFTRKNLLIFLGILIVVFFPQMLYWCYMFGMPIHYSYEGESFSNGLAPHLAEIWFAPLNGLFLYNPAWLVFMAGVILMIISRQRNGILIFLFFLLISYIVASWHSWFFGCGYGHRAFIDFLPLFAIPFGILTERTFRMKTRLPAALVILLLTAMSYYNLRLIYSYSGCFFGSVWDWQRYSRQLYWAGFYTKQDPVFIFTNDFETGAISPEDPRTDSTSRSYSWSVLFDDWRQTGCRKTFHFYEFALPFPTHAETRVFIKSPDGDTKGAFFYCFIERKGHLLWEDSCLVGPFIHSAGKWCEAKHAFIFPPEMQWDATITFQVRNPGGAHFYADDQKIILY